MCSRGRRRQRERGLLGHGLLLPVREIYDEHALLCAGRLLVVRPHHA